MISVSEIQEAKLSSLPVRIQKLVELDNQRFESWVQDMVGMRVRENSNCSASFGFKNEMFSLYWLW